MKMARVRALPRTTTRVPRGSRGASLKSSDDTLGTPSTWRPPPPWKEGFDASEPGVEGGAGGARWGSVVFVDVDAAIIIGLTLLAWSTFVSLCGAGLLSSRDVDVVSLMGASSSSEVVAAVAQRAGWARAV